MRSPHPVHRFLAALTWAALLSLVAQPSGAAQPPGGVLSTEGDSVSWTGGPMTSFNPSTATCVEGISCDTFELELNVPLGRVGVVRARLEWESADDDFDLHVFDAEGRQMEASTQGGTRFEEVLLTALAPGRYRLTTNAWLVTQASYAGSAQLEAVVDPPLDDAPGFGPIRFSDDTVVDFSAVSGEPFIRLDAEDNVYVTVPFGLSTTVSLLWKSLDGGRTFIPLGTPIVRDSVTGPGGGDSHLDFDANGFLYFVDLSGACVTAAVSTDGGNTFPPERNNPLTCFNAEHPEAAQDDRQWVGAFGDRIGYATWRNLLILDPQNFWLFRTADGGLSWDEGRVLGNVTQSGPFQVDKKKRPVEVGGEPRPAILSYQIFYRGTNLRVFRIADFDDGSLPS